MIGSSSCGRLMVAMATAFGIGGAFARPVAVPTLPPSEFADTESVTNLAIDVSHENMGRLDIGLAANATPSNNVQIAFGVDADGDGALEPMETEAVVGWDGDALFSGRTPEIPPTLFNPNWNCLRVTSRGHALREESVIVSPHRNALVLQVR